MALLKAGLDEKDLPTARKMGDTPAALASAAKVVEAEYYSPYLEPRDDGADDLHRVVQGRRHAARVDLDAERRGVDGRGLGGRRACRSRRCEVHKMMLGGGFGRRGAPQDYVKQSVLIAKQFPGKPVKLMWSREEDMQHGFYRPVSLVRMKAGARRAGQRGRDALDDRVPVDPGAAASRGHHRTASTSPRCAP